MQQAVFANMQEYNTQREALLAEAFSLKFPGLTFTDNELKANEILKKIITETNEKLDTKFHFRPITYRNIVEPSLLYKLFTDMPKGSQQHSHNSCHLPSKWFVERSLTPDVYVNDQGKLQLFETEPEAGYKNVLKLREEASNKEDFDKSFEDKFHLTLEEFESEKIWDGFEFKIANRMLISLKDGLWEQYMTDTFCYAIEEGYNNLQIRVLVPFYEQKNFMDPEEEVQLYKRALAKAKEKDPNFTIGIQLVGLRFWDHDKIKKFLDITYQLSKKHRDVLIGFDLVAEEALCPAIDFVPVLLEHLEKARSEGFDLPFLFHAGESLTQKNTNMYDAFLLGSKRIGHGLNLFKHPYLIPKIKERGICIEANPLSNQILRYVSDLRLHPAIGYHNAGVKVSISSDDIELFQLHTMWDFFVAAISFEFDLLDFKRVILNSIETSCLEKNLQDTIHKDWHKKWDSFVAGILEGKYN